jgi:hypothetical protein
MKSRCKLPNIKCVWQMKPDVEGGTIGKLSRQYMVALQPFKSNATPGEIGVLTTLKLKIARFHVSCQKLLIRFSRCLKVMRSRCNLQIGRYQMCWQIKPDVERTQETTSRWLLKVQRQCKTQETDWMGSRNGFQEPPISNKHPWRQLIRNMRKFRQLRKPKTPRNHLFLLPTTLRLILTKPLG